MLQAYAHQSYPFDQLIEDLQLKRDLSRSPLFDIVVAMETETLESGAKLEANSLVIHKFEKEHLVSKYDLTCTFRDQEQGIGLTLEYNTGLLNRNTAEQLLAHYTQLCRAIVQNPQGELGGVSLLGEEEFERVVRGYNRTQQPSFEAVSVTDLLERQARRTPHHVALEYNGRSVSYEHLHQRANRLARLLKQTYRLQPDDLVALVFDRSPDMLTAILAVLKTGAAYLPIDPQHPPDRAAYMLDHSQAKLLLCQRAYAGPLTRPGVPVLAIEQLEPELALCPEAPLEVVNRPGDLAYLMYTSGSTGRPKGVEVTHGSVGNFLLSMQQRPGLKATDRLLAVTTYSFDISVLELLLPLVSGATVLLVARDQVEDAAKLAEQITRLRPSVMQATPALWQMLLEAGWQGEGQLVALCGGERLSPALAGRLLERVGCLWNMYGPTETTIWSSLHRVGSSQEAACIGAPIANTQLYVLNAGRQPLPAGVEGDLYIGGLGLARGYRQQAELTSECFLANPFGLGRLYRTGDRAKWTRAGELVFLGRSDGQIKLRGHRVEPAEIEQVLLAHPHVRQAAVLASQAADEGLSLTAYLVASDSLGLSSLRQHLAAALPAYMVPAEFVVVAQFPLTANGKLDKQALPALAGNRLAPATAHVAAAGPLQAQLVGIWEEVLQRPGVGTADNFFELGGHSLRAMQVLARVHQLLGVEVSLRELFSRPTVGELAGLLQQKGTGNGELAGLLQQKGGASDQERASGAYRAIELVAPQPHYPLSHGQRRLWVAGQFTEGSLAYNVAGAYRIEGELDRGAFRRAFLRLVERHESLRTVFPLVAGQPVQRVCSRQELGVDLVEQDLSAEQGRQAARRLASQELAQGFDLARGPLVRGRLLHLGPREHVLLLTLHHIITDGWSMEVLVREWMQLYQAHQQGAPDPLPPLRLQYKDYAHWQHQQLESARMAPHRRYWLEQFAAPPQPLALPLDNARPPVLSHRGRRVSRTISSAEFQPMIDLSQSQQVSVYNLLMAMVNVLLYRYTEQEDIVVGYPLAMRNSVELENQVGFYLNTMALRTCVTKREPFLSVVHKVRQGMLEASEHQHYPFDQMISTLGHSRNTSRSPLFDVVVVLQNLEIHQQTQIKIKDVTVEAFPVDDVVAPVDLRIEFVQHAREMTVNFDYNRELYKPETISQLADRFLLLFKQVLTNPIIPVEEVVFGEEATPQKVDVALSYFKTEF
jgi:amino acid adenylation domain-containing protein